MRHAMDCSVNAPTWPALPCDCAGVYRVLKPRYEKVGGGALAPDGTPYWQRIAGWDHLGYARDMADALTKFPRSLVNGYSPVLEWIGSMH